MFYNYKSGIDILREAIENGDPYNQKFKAVLKVAEKANSEINRIKGSGIYQGSFIDDKVKEYADLVVKTKDDMFRLFIADDQAKIDKIKAKYTPQELTDSEVNRKLLEIKQFENKIKFMDDYTLAEIPQKYWNNELDLDQDKVNIVGAELRARGNFSVADHLSMYASQRIPKNPWEDDEEYKAAIQEQNELSPEIGTRSICVVDENGNKQVIDLDKIVY